MTNDRIIIDPDNALAHSQHGEPTKFLCRGCPDAQPPVRFAHYTGQEGDATRAQIVNRPPHILLTHCVMLEYRYAYDLERTLFPPKPGTLQAPGILTIEPRQATDRSAASPAGRSRADSHCT